MDNKIGATLKTLRLNNSLKQVDIASFLNIQQSTYARYESNHCEPDIFTIIKLADFFGVSTDFLLKGIEYEKSSTHLFDFSQEEIELFKKYKGLSERDKRLIKIILNTN